MAQMYKVVRVIAGIDGESIFAGTIVDASQWRNTRALVAAGRLIPVEDETPAAPTAEKKPAKKAAAKKVAAETTPADEEPVTDDVDF